MLFYDLCLVISESFNISYEYLRFKCGLHELIHLLDKSNQKIKQIQQQNNKAR